MVEGDFHVWSSLQEDGAHPIERLEPKPEMLYSAKWAYMWMHLRTYRVKRVQCEMHTGVLQKQKSANGQ